MLHNSRIIERYKCWCIAGGNLNSNPKEVLALFVEKAEELRQEEFVAFLQESGHQFSYRFTSESQNIVVSEVAPTETMNKSFILTYRMFIQANEGLRLLDPTKPISSVLLDASLSTEWKDQLQDVAGKIHAYLLDQPKWPIDITLVDEHGSQTTEVLTRWDILDTFVYGQYAHTTKQKRLRNWLSTPFASTVRGMLMMELRNIMIFTLRGIHHLVPYAQKELDVLP